MNKIKATSFEYGNDYQNNQVQKYLDRANNHWKHRIDIFQKLISIVLNKQFTNTAKSDILVSDIGCSIGTFAIEAARMGFKSCGIDFDASALDIAKKLSAEEGVKVEYFCGDVAAADLQFGKTDIAICFDIFEHLHDDELGAFLLSIKQNLSEKGHLIFHTFPTQYDYLFFQNRYLYLALLPFSIFPNSIFNKIVKLYALNIDAIFILFKGIFYKDYIKNQAHCNPLSKKRLQDILQRAGFEIELLETNQLYQNKKKRQNFFKKHTISHRNLYGIAYPKK